MNGKNENNELSIHDLVIAIKSSRSAMEADPQVNDLIERSRKARKARSMLQKNNQNQSNQE